ncbi:MAG: hypothetical protein H6745_10985 [Deltaproteobacteria bacterium]|nr:hypothetical protein [Deltaproteobacteria bacterium]
MPRRLAEALGLGLALVALSATLPGVAATARAATIPANAAEEEAVKSAESGKYTRAREQAEKILAADPRSIAGTFVLADVFYSWEADHAKALYLIRRARDLLEAAFGKAPDEPVARIWHKKILTTEIYILGEMDRKQEQLGVIDAYDALYAPKLTRMRIWPLMKLGRYDEALAVGKELALSPDLYERVSAYNGLMAVEDERLRREASYEWGKKGIEATQGKSCILFHNTAQASISMFKFAAAEENARKAINAEIDDCPNTSYEHLATLYLLEGEFQKSVSAFKKLVSHPIDRRYRPHFAMNNRAILVELLYALGKGEEGLEYAQQVFDAPDRSGMVSVSMDDVRFGHAVAYWGMLELRRAELEEDDAAASFFDSGAMKRAATLREVKLRQWELQRVLIRLSIADDRLVTNLRPYVRGVKPWYAGNLARILGPGLISAAIDRAQADDADLPAARGYFESLRGEVAFWSGDMDEAIRRAQAALEVMPKETRLLAWRTEAYLAEALQRSGREQDAAAHWRTVLREYPSALPQLGFAVPVTLRHGAGELATDVADALEDSPRLEVEEGGAPFVVEVEADAEVVRICLSASDGFRFNCSETPIADDKALAAFGGDRVKAAVHDFHRTVFAPKVELTSSDINSLDGSPVRVNADRVLEGLIEAPKLDGDKKGEE